MKIGIYTPYLDTISGGERYMLSIAKALAQKNELSIFWDKSEEVNIKRNSSDKLGINIDNIKFEENIFSNSISTLNRYKKSNNYDKIIMLSDGSIPFLNSELYIHFQFPISGISSFLTNLKAKKVKKIFCNSQFTKKYIDEKFKINSVVIYPPVALITKSSKRENTIINVGRLQKLEENSYFKRQDVLIQAFKELVNLGHSNWKLILIISTRNNSDEKELVHLKKFVDKYPIEILHNPNREIVETEYAKAKIYWHAAGFNQNIDKHPELAEHFGITTVEAMSAGLVPIVFAAGGQEEIIQTGKSGFLWKTTTELISKTKELINDPNELESMSTNAKKAVRDFSEERFYQDIRNLVK